MVLIGLGSSVFAVTNDFHEGAEAKQGISFYNANYAMLGVDPIVEMKLQFSFKYRFVEPGTFDGQWSKPVNNLFFAYTQKMLWDLEKNSSPYEDANLDSSFSPELFWMYRDLFPISEKATMDLQFGYQHESNGRAGESERTWDRLYVQPSWTWGETGDWQAVSMLKIWIPVGVGEEMDDIGDYFGPGEFWLKVGQHDGMMLETMLRKGSNDWNGAVELSASYPVRSLNLFVYGQVFYGYGETLRLYDQETTSYRLGISFSR